MSVQRKNERKRNHNGTSSNKVKGFRRYSSIDSSTQSDDTKCIPNERHWS